MKVRRQPRTPAFLREWDVAVERVPRALGSSFTEDSVGETVPCRRDHPDYGPIRGPWCKEAGRFRFKWLRSLLKNPIRRTARRAAAAGLGIMLVFRKKPYRYRYDW